MISVCMASHNGGKYIKEQIESIISQLSDNDELIISDDGSVDDTLLQIQSIRDERIKLIQMKHEVMGKPPHYYVTKNFENALKYAKGDIIFLSDQDDVWLPNKVSRCLSALDGYMAVMHNLELVDEDLSPLGFNCFNKDIPFRRNNFLMLRGLHMGAAMAFKKDLLKNIMPFPKQLVAHDFWIGLLAELSGGLLFLDEILVKYRIHDNNTSGSHSKNKNTVFYKVYYRLYTMMCVVCYHLRNRFGHWFCTLKK